jgi:hypothetical protein
MATGPFISVSHNLGGVAARRLFLHRPQAKKTHGRGKPFPSRSGTLNEKDGGGGGRVDALPLLAATVCARQPRGANFSGSAANLPAVVPAFRRRIDRNH